MPRATLHDILIPGITGKIGIVGKAPHAQPYGPNTVKKFHSACHAIARAVHGQVSRTQEPWQAHTAWSGNFHLATVTPGRGEPFHIFLHSVIPLVATARASPRALFEFDAPTEIEPFFESEFLIADEHLLAISMNAVTLPDTFTRAEHYDIKYWKPQTVADLAFNSFD